MKAVPIICLPDGRATAVDVAPHDAGARLDCVNPGPNLPTTAP